MRTILLTGLSQKLWRICRSKGSPRTSEGDDCHGIDQERGRFATSRECDPALPQLPFAEFTPASRCCRSIEVEKEDWRALLGLAEPEDGGACFSEIGGCAENAHNVGQGVLSSEDLARLGESSGAGLGFGDDGHDAFEALPELL